MHIDQSSTSLALDQGLSSHLQPTSQQVERFAALIQANHTLRQSHQSELYQKAQANRDIASEHSVQTQLNLEVHLLDAAFKNMRGEILQKPITFDQQSDQAGEGAEVLSLLLLDSNRYATAVNLMSGSAESLSEDIRSATQRKG